MLHALLRRLEGRHRRMLTTAAGTGAALVFASGVISPTTALADPKPAGADAGAVPASAVTTLALTAGDEVSEATQAQKRSAAEQIPGLLDDPELLGLSDCNFTFRVYDKTTDDYPEVRQAAAEAVSTSGEACTDFIVTGIHQAAQRDRENKIRADEIRRERTLARKKAAAVLDIIATEDLLVLSDRDFVYKLWQKADQLGRPNIKAAAHKAFEGTGEDQLRFISTGIYEAHDRDIAEGQVKDTHRAAKARVAAQVLGIVADQQLLDMTDDNFLREVLRRATPGSRVANAAEAALRSTNPEDWKKAIETGLLQAANADNAADLAKRDQERVKAIQDILARVTKEGYQPNLHAAATAALKGTPDDRMNFLATGQYEARKRDIEAMRNHSLKNLASYKCLDADAAQAANNGAAVMLWDCTGAKNQQWYWTPSEQIRNAVTGKCLDAAGGQANTNGGKVQLWDCNDSKNQQWYWDTAGRIRNAVAGKCLDADASQANTNGGKVHLWDCNNGKNQQWRRGAGQVRNVVSSKCLTAAGNGTANGAKVMLWDCDGRLTQLWYSDTAGRIHNAAAGKCLEVNNSDLANERFPARVSVGDCHNNWNQKWSMDRKKILHEALAGTWCLGAAAGQASNNGGTVQVQICNDTPNQRWR